MSRLRLARGFTLVELLVVVAIVAILSAIALANLSMAKRRANQAACAANLKVVCYALFAYKLDENHYPPADGIAGLEPSPGLTELGNGPAANGSWDGVPRALIERHYLTNDRCLFCPHFRERFSGDPARAQRFRYAYNSSASDTGTVAGGQTNIDADGGDAWLCRCMWVPVERSFTPTATDVAYPHGESGDRENALMSNGRVELRDGRADYGKAFPRP